MLTGTLVLAPGVVVFPVSRLPAALRPLVREDDRFALTRTSARGTTKLLDEPTAALVERLREPTLLVDAVVAVARELGLDPHLFLEDAFGTAARLVAEGILLPAAEPGVPGSALGPGDVLGPFTLERQVQVLDDVSVFRASDPGGRPVAVKVAGGATSDGGGAAMRHEARILERLDGPWFPRLVHDGADEEVAYLAIEWLEGLGALPWSAGVRRPWSATAGDELVEGVLALSDAFAELHRRGVVHADVHPRNLLMGESGAHILDFSLSVVPGDEELGTARRGGVLSFYEPEWAAAALAGRAYPAATERSDQYGLGAVLYRLLTGGSHLGPQADRRTTLRRIVTENPWPFDLHGVPAWPEVEAVLARSMATDPAERFDSVADLAGALRTATAEYVGHRASLTAERLAAEVGDRLGRPGGLVDLGLAAPPYASVNYGAAGIAYYWYRLGVLRQEPAHLLSAMRWLDHAQSRRSGPDAFGNADIGITPATVGTTSLYHSPAGVHCVSALVHNAMGNVEGAAEAAERFVESARGSERLDLVSGRPSALVGAALLAEALGRSNRATPGLARFADAELAGLWTELEGETLDGTALRYWGMAHGWAGVLFGTFRWCEASTTPIPAAALERLGELSGRVRCEGERRSWVGPNDPALASSWCHGSAGYTQLWAAAAKLTSDPEHVANCVGAAEHCWSAPTLNENLCCGAAGQGYAMLVAHQLTGEDRWLGRAHELAERGLEWLGNAWTHPNALYKGDLGIALLMEDLADPTGAAMPLFSPEGWPN